MCIKSYNNKLLSGCYLSYLTLVRVLGTPYNVPSGNPLHSKDDVTKVIALNHKTWSVYIQVWLPRAQCPRSHYKVIMQGYTGGGSVSTKWRRRTALPFTRRWYPTHRRSTWLRRRSRMKLVSVVGEFFWYVVIKVAGRNETRGSGNYS